LNALIYLYSRSLKNRFWAALRNPKFLAKTVGLLLFLGIIGVSILATSIERAGLADLPLIQGLVFLVFLLPYWAGRLSGGGSFGMDDVNFIFTAPILPRTVLLSGLVRRLGGILIIAFSAMFIAAFVVMLGSSVGATITVPMFSNILVVGLFGLILAVVCKLLGIFLFVAYREAYRWVGLFWLGLLAGFFVLYAYRAWWDWGYGLIALLDSPIFALTPLVGWAAAGAMSFITGHVLWGLLYTGVLLAAGGYFFWVVYHSRPDFYEEALGIPAESAASHMPQQQDGSATMQHLQRNEPMSAQPQPLDDQALARNHLKSQGIYNAIEGLGAKIFHKKHILEQIRISGSRFYDTGLIAWIVFAVAWGIYSQSTNVNLEFVAMLYILVGVPSETILAVLMPLVFAAALYPQYDRGFTELNHPYFYLVPEPPKRKLLWISMTQITGIGCRAALVLGLAGVISRTSPSIVLSAMLAYAACAIMVLGIRVASVRLLGMVHSARQKLATTMAVMSFVLIGWVGMMAIFFLGPSINGLLIALLAFAGWCTLAGGLGIVIAIKTLHNVDAPV